MKKKYKLLLLLSLILILFISLTYLKKDNILSIDKFDKIVKKENLKTVDVKDSFDTENINDAIIAYNKYGDYQIEYIIFNDVETTKSAFLINKNDFKTDKNDNDIETFESSKKSSKYELITKEKYMYISRIDNSLIYVNTDITYKDETKNIIDKLGY